VAIGCDLRGGASIEGSLPGILFSDDITWTEIRRLSLTTLRDFGFGKKALEDTVDEEVDDLLEYIDNHYANTPLDVRQFFNIAVLGSLWRIISGERLRKDDPKLIELVNR
jgi:hypothetical protein